MIDLKKLIIGTIINTEKGYVDDPTDSGGETNFGITRKAAEAHGYCGHMRDMPKSVVFDIITNDHWNIVRGDDLLLLSNLIAQEVVDTSVNIGPINAARFLQRSLNVLNRGGLIYPDLSNDGVIGSKTIAALKSYLAVRRVSILARALNTLQGAYYITLVEQREKDERFIYGWLTKRADLPAIQSGVGGGPPDPTKPK